MSPRSKIWTLEWPPVHPPALEPWKAGHDLQIGGIRPHFRFSGEHRLEDVGAVLIEVLGHGHVIIDDTFAAPFHVGLLGGPIFAVGVETPLTDAVDPFVPFGVFPGCVAVDQFVCDAGELPLILTADIMGIIHVNLLRLVGMVGELGQFYRSFGQHLIFHVRGEDVFVRLELFVIATNPDQTEVEDLDLEWRQLQSNTGQPRKGFLHLSFA